VNSLCRRCRKPLEIDEPEALSPQLVTTNAQGAEEAEGIDVARAVREVRHDRCLSQRQLAGRMQVPRTYISKIENAKAVPTLSSLQRLATALEVGICDLLRDGHSRRARETAAVLADPFLAEIAPLVMQLDAFQRDVRCETAILNQGCNVTSSAIGTGNGGGVWRPHSSSMAGFWPQPFGTGPFFPASSSFVAKIHPVSVAPLSSIRKKWLPSLPIPICRYTPSPQRGLRFLHGAADSGSEAAAGLYNLPERDLLPTSAAVTRARSSGTLR
jgi:transcriptional regulator with XRE-family HTH domain